MNFLMKVLEKTLLFLFVYILGCSETLASQVPPCSVYRFLILYHIMDMNSDNAYTNNIQGWIQDFPEGGSIKRTRAKRVRNF